MTDRTRSSSQPPFDRDQDYNRFIAGVTSTYSLFDASRDKLFDTFSNDLMYWPSTIEYTDRPAACYLFCDFVLKNKCLPANPSAFDHQSPRLIQDYPGLLDFLAKKNISPATFTRNLIDKEQFFYLYAVTFHHYNPAFYSFCAFLKTFQVCDTTNERTCGFFAMDHVSSYFCIGGALNRSINNEERKDEEQKDAVQKDEDTRAVGGRAENLAQGRGRVRRRRVHTVGAFT